ncbi:FeoB-associated Cys-rich membrane protein [Sphingobacterium wenxiniae]|uniref:FeoB-associated Cys-rich membrane protein n=1 Tax=Sphingobacterium wenxiniae TaxID=683125 RepID=UPI000B8941E5
MDSLTIQYILITVIFLVAVYYLIRRFLPSKKRNSGGCNKGCGCAMDETKK